MNRPSASIRNRRAGYSLVEVLVVASVASVVLATISVSLHLMFRVDRRMREQTAALHTFARLAKQFREDVNAAQGAEIGDGETTDRRLSLTLAGGRTIEYRFEERRVQRAVGANDKIEHYDLFRLPAGLTADAALSENDPQQVAAVVVARRPDMESATSGGGQQVLRIEATVGRDGRYGPGEQRGSEP